MVGGTNDFRLLSPNGAVTVGVSGLLSLPVSIVVEINAHQAKKEDCSSKGKPQVIRVVDQVEGRACVY